MKDKGKITIDSNILFYIGYFVYVFTMTYNLTLIEIVNIRPLYTNIVVLFFISLRELTRKRISIRRLLVVLFVFICVSLVFIKTTYTTPVLIVLLLIGSKDSDVDKLVRIHFYTAGSIVLLVTILSQVGIIKDYVVVDTVHGGALRHSMGTAYASIWASMATFVLCDYLLLNYYRLKKRNIIIYSVLCIYVYYMTDSRLTFILSFFLLLIKYFSRRTVLMKISLYVFPISVIATMGIMYAYFRFPSQLAILNDLSNQRLVQPATAISKYGIHMFGRYFITQGLGSNLDMNWDIGYMYIDSMYLNILLQYGMVLLILFTVYICYLASMARKTDDMISAILIIIVSIFGMVTGSFINFYSCSFLLYINARLSGSIRSKRWIEQPLS